jgi:KTSC domain
MLAEWGEGMARVGARLIALAMIIATARAETVDVKYRGPVDLAPFKCETITRSSFIRRVCYDEKNAYVLINLSGTWYHYCEIDQGTVSNLLAAESMGRYYNLNIKGWYSNGNIMGPFDCRTHHVPAYP